MLPVQYSAPYEFIGGPREDPDTNLRANKIPSPSFADDTLGTWVTSINSGGTINEVGVRDQWAHEDAPDHFAGFLQWTAPADTTSRSVEMATSSAVDAPTVIPAGAGLVYSARVRVNIVSAAVGQPFSFRMIWYDVAGSNLGSTQVVSTANAASGEFYLELLNRTAPASTAGIQIRVGFPTINSASDVVAFYWDAAMIVKGSTLPARYFDGNTPGYYWTGEPNASISAQDGTRAVLNDESDPDFVGYAAEVTGLSGAEVRESFTDNIEADGGTHGEFYMGRRPFTITAAIGGNTTPTVRNQRLARWSQATRALRTRGPHHREGVMYWTVDGYPAAWTKFRRQVAPEPTGYTLKSAPVGLVSADPRAYSALTNHVRHAATGSGTAGRSYDRSYNLNFGWAPSRGSTVATNAGDADSAPMLTLHSPTAISSTLAIVNDTTGEEIALNGSLLAGETYIIDPYAQTVTHYTAAGVATNAFDRVELPRTRWIRLMPGDNIIVLQAGVSGSGLELRIDWRDAWV